VSRPRGRIAFLLSGSGSTLKNLLERIDEGEVPGDVVVAVADRPGAKGLDHARGRGIPVAVVERRAYAAPEAFSHAIDEVLRSHAPDLVALGGFLSIFRIPPDLRGRILNVHPSLLPAFGGKGFHGEHVHRAVLERGVRVTGCTVHLVNDEVDGGPIVEQTAVRVEPGDTPASLADRVQEAERDLYPRCIRWFLEGRLRVRDGRVELLPPGDGPTLF
jgi:formyltetrahydrofolate-dependent phosphoribosylglycinamide formyltransferase